MVLTLEYGAAQVLFSGASASSVIRNVFHAASFSRPFLFLLVIVRPRRGEMLSAVLVMP